MDVLSYFGTHALRSSLFSLPHAPSVIYWASALVDNGKNREFRVKKTWGQIGSTIYHPTCKLINLPWPGFLICKMEITSLFEASILNLESRDRVHVCAFVDLQTLWESRQKCCEMIFLEGGCICFHQLLKGLANHKWLRARLSGLWKVTDNASIAPDRVACALSGSCCRCSGPATYRTWIRGAGAGWTVNG